MKYIIINTEEMTVDVSGRLSKTGYVLPAEIDRSKILQDPMASVVYFDVLYPSVLARDRRRGVPDVSYCLIAPDPWLMAIAALMWQGIVQGLTWDVVKACVLQAISVLRNNGLAPSEGGEVRSVRSSTRLGFSYTGYATSGRKRREMFLGLERKYRSMPQHERDRVTKCITARDKKCRR